MRFWAQCDRFDMQMNLSRLVTHTRNAQISCLLKGIPATNLQTFAVLSTNSKKQHIPILGHIKECPKFSGKHFSGFYITLSFTVPEWKVVWKQEMKQNQRTEMFTVWCLVVFSLSWGLKIVIGSILCQNKSLSYNPALYSLLACLGCVAHLNKYDMICSCVWKTACLCTWFNVLLLPPGVKSHQYQDSIFLIPNTFNKNSGRRNKE